MDGMWILFVFMFRLVGCDAQRVYRGNGSFQRINRFPECFEWGV